MTVSMNLTAIQNLHWLDKNFKRKKKKEEAEKKVYYVQFFYALVNLKLGQGHWHCMQSLKISDKKNNIKVSVTDSFTTGFMAGWMLIIVQTHKVSHGVKDLTNMSNKFCIRLRGFVSTTY